MAALLVALTLLLSYLIGAVPFGYLVARWRGVDIMRQGSGNIGATNVGRVLGRRYGILVFLLDFAKGALPVLAAKAWSSGQELNLWPDTLPVAAAVAAFLGHLFPVYLRFRGGKGVATAAGAVTVLVPGPTLAALLTWVAVVLASRYVSLASLTAAIVLCLVRLLLTAEPWGSTHAVVTGFCLVAAGLIFVRHRANVSRLLHGNENRLQESAAMLQLGKTLHVLALGLWFGTVIFFSFVVGLNLFGTLEGVGRTPKAERPNWFPLWDAYDGKSPDPLFPAPLRSEQGTRAAGVAIHPLFQWYFGIQAVCAPLAFVTALGWGRRKGERVHRLRRGILLAALLTVGVGWWLEQVVDELREPRNRTFDAMVSQDPPRSADVEAAVQARQAFRRWHFYSLGVNMLTVALVTTAMALAAQLPAAVHLPQPVSGKEEPSHAAVPT
jgi:glycerol-3-phosphate acyltransferase PlsY